MQVDVTVGVPPARPIALRPAGRVVVDSHGDVIALIGESLEASGSQRRVELTHGGVKIRDADLEIDHILGRHAGDRSAADVLDPEGACAKPRAQPRDQRGGSRAPRVVVAHDNCLTAGEWRQRSGA